MQHLRTEQLLGTQFVPIVVCRPSGASSSRTIRSSTDLESQNPSPEKRPKLVRTANPVAGFVQHSRATGNAEANLARLKILDDSKVKGCKLCELHCGRTQTVFGQGSPTARVVFVGEGPGYEEDKQGLAFVGPAGQLLTKMIIAMGLTRDEVYICNVVKCRPPGNRTPSAEEILACSPYLHEQLAIIQPEMIIALGAPAAKTLLNTADAIGKLRGRFHQYQVQNQATKQQGNEVSGQEEEATGNRQQATEMGLIPVMPTYHPAYLLRNPDDKRKVWEDLQLVMARMGLAGRTND